NMDTERCGERRYALKTESWRSADERLARAMEIKGVESLTIVNSVCSTYIDMEAVQENAKLRIQNVAVTKKLCLPFGDKMFSSSKSIDFRCQIVRLQYRESK
ncbi:hypothetical protein L9F63_020801, partial [Diploptera punctata]